MLAPGNVRFEPIFGGLTTLIYFGDDFGQKLLDQRIAPGWVRQGTDLEHACAVQDPDEDSDEAANSDNSDRTLDSPLEPDFTPLWMPASIDGHPLTGDERCDESGHPTGPDAKTFCMFGRLALRPHESAPLVIVVHGMFDSSAQTYVRRIGTTLFAAGYSTLLVDMRDHGDTFRGAPKIPTTLGMFEGRDLLTVARQVRGACAEHVSSIGAVGVSGGGLDVISAYAEDGRAGDTQLDGGAVALSPLLDVEMTVGDMAASRTCSTLEAIELTWGEHLVLGAAGALTLAGGAAVADKVNHNRVGAEVAIAAGIGAVSGVALGLLLDALADGDSATSHGCVGRSAVAELFDQLLHERWRTLHALGPMATTGTTLSHYLKYRVEPYYWALGSHPQWAKPASLAAALRERESRKSKRARLLVIGAEDDPVIHVDSLRSFARETAALSDVHVIELPHGGHGAFWIVQKALTRKLLSDFLGVSAAN